jgi:hypothetical protein
MPVALNEREISAVAETAKRETETPTTIPLTDAEWRRIAHDLEKKMPEVWRTLYPRIYPSSPRCGLYCSPKEPAHVFLAQRQKFELGQVAKYSMMAEHPSLVMAGNLVRCAMPQIWISREMADAIRETKPPIDLDWTTMQLPFPAMIFMLPKGSLVHPTLGDVQFMTYCRASRYRADGVAASNFALMIHTERRIILYCSLAGDKSPIVPLGNLARLQEEVLDIYQNGPLPPGFEVPLDSQGSEVEKKAIHLLFGALLVMQDRPSLVTESNLINRVHKKRAEPKEFWSPRVLGEHYRMIRPESVYQGGHHSSPRLHWVRGHWRDQPYGPGREQRHMIWVEHHTRGITEQSA